MSYTFHDLATDVAKELDISIAAAERAIKATSDVIVKQANMGEAVKIPQFGVFKVAHRAAKTARNPQTGEPVNVPAKSILTFKAAKSLRDL